VQGHRHDQIDLGQRQDERLARRIRQVRAGAILERLHEPVATEIRSATNASVASKCGGRLRQLRTPPRRAGKGAPGAGLEERGQFGDARPGTAAPEPPSAHRAAVFAGPGMDVSYAGVE